MNDIDWVTDLLPKIEKDQDEYNAGKFRGAIFQMNFIARETRKLAIKSNNRITHLSPKHNAGLAGNDTGALKRTKTLAANKEAGRKFAGEGLATTLGAHNSSMLH